MAKFESPNLHGAAFTCSACGTYAQQRWSNGLFRRSSNGTGFENIPLARCYCVSCYAVSFWSEDSKTAVFPRAALAPLPHPALPSTCVPVYLEARLISGDSPRAAAALLRLCVQSLLIELGGKGRNIDDDIAALVVKGLPAQVKDALDICRVVGNNAVHPGEIAVNDEPEMVGQLFELVNFIVRETIERAENLQKLIGKLPLGAREAIERRDARAVNGAASPILPFKP